MIYVSTARLNRGQPVIWTPPRSIINPHRCPAPRPRGRDLEEWRRREIRRRERPEMNLAVAFGTSTQSANGSSATSTNKPASAAAGDYVMAVANCYEDSSIASFTWDSGNYTEITKKFENRPRIGTHSMTLGCAGRILTGSEGSTISVTNSNTRYQNVMAMRFTGTDQTTPVDQFSVTSIADGGGAQDGSSYTATWATLGANVARSGSLAVAILGGYDKNGNAAPTGYTRQINGQDGVNDINYLASVNAGSFTSPAVTIGANASGGSNMVCLILVILQPPSAATVDSFPFGSASRRTARDVHLLL